MTRSRVCPDTESTGLSPASDALPVRETAEQFAQVFFGKSVSLLTSSGLATVSRFRSGTAARTLSATARHARDRSGRTVADPYGAAESGLLTSAMTPPVAGRQNRHSGDWDPLYRVQTETRDDSGKKHDVPEDFI